MRHDPNAFGSGRQAVDVSSGRTRLIGAASSPHLDRSQLILGAIVAFAVLLVVVQGPLVALQLMAIALVLVLTVKFPEYVLTLTVAGSFAGSQFTEIAVISGLVLLIGACASLLAMATSQFQVRWQRLVLPAVILLWFGLRVMLERDFPTVGAVTVCAATLVIVLYCLQSRRDVIMAMAVGGILFTAASAGFGVESPSGRRFEGFSGNPNRMVYGLMLYLPFFFATLGRRRPTLIRIASLAASVLAVRLVFISGSSQGIVGLGVIVSVILMCWAIRLAPAIRGLVVIVLFVSVVIGIGAAVRVVQSSEDLSTLSGRTFIYVAAIHDIARNPFFGSGLQRFSEGVVMDRSAHSVTLALAWTGGIPLALAWIAVLVMLMAAAVVLIRQRSPLAAAPAVLLAEQFVQTVQLVPCTWVVIGIFLMARSPGELGEPPPLEKRPRVRSAAAP